MPAPKTAAICTENQPSLNTNQCGSDIVELHAGSTPALGAIDLVAVYGAACRMIRVVDEGAGTKLLAVKCIGVNGTAVDRTLTVKNDWIMPIMCTHILVATTVARIQVVF